MSTTKQPEMVQVAHRYIAKGVSVFPVWWAVDGGCGCPKAKDCKHPGKHPITKNGFKDSTTEGAQVNAWWGKHPEANIGMPTDGLVVLDVDPRNGGDEALAALTAKHGPLPETRRVRTGGDGSHLYFQRPPELKRVVASIGPGLDIKSNGGYVLLPYSSHVSGNFYRSDPSGSFFKAIAEPPEWLLALVQGTGDEHTPADKATDWAALLAGAAEGERHAVTLRVAGHYLGKGLTADEVEAILLPFAARCTPPYDEGDVRRVVRDLAAKQQPDGWIPVMTTLSDIEPIKVAWLWRGRVARGKITVLAGDGGKGKTRVTLDIAARVTVGAAWPDGGLAPGGDVIILSSEDGLGDTVRPFVDNQRGDPRHIHIILGTRNPRLGTDRPFNLERDLASLEHALIDKSASLVIISPLSAYLGNKDSYKDAEIRGILTPLAALADRHQAAIIAVMHLTKNDDRKLVQRVQGSAAFGNQARMVLIADTDPKTPDRFLLASTKNNLGPKPPALAYRIKKHPGQFDVGHLTWDPEPVEGDADELFNIRKPLPRAERDEARAFLLTALSSGPVAANEIEAAAEAQGISRRTLDRARTALGVIAEQTRVKGRLKSSLLRLPRDI